MEDTEVAIGFQIRTDGLTKAKPWGIICPYDLVSVLLGTQLRVALLPPMTVQAELAHDECFLSRSSDSSMPC